MGIAQMGSWAGKDAYTGFKGGQYAPTGSSLAGGIAGGVGVATSLGQQLLSMRESKVAAVNKDNPFYAGAGTKTAEDILEIIEIAAAIGLIAFGGPAGWVAGGATLASKGVKYA